MSVVQSRTAVGAGVVMLGAGHVRLVVLVTCETLAGRDHGRHDAMRCDAGQMGVGRRIFRVLLMGLWAKMGIWHALMLIVGPIFAFAMAGMSDRRSWGSRGEAAKQSRAALSSSTTTNHYHAKYLHCSSHNA